MIETKQQTDENTNITLNSKEGETFLQYTETVISFQSDDIELLSIDTTSNNQLQNSKSRWEDWKSKIYIAVISAIFGGLINAVILKTDVYRIVVKYRCYNKPYFTLESDSTQLFYLSKEVPFLEFSVREEKWEEVGTKPIIFGGSHGKLMLRGQNNTGTDGAVFLFATKSKVFCNGDIRTLIDYKHYNNVDTKEANFSNLFEGCTQLISVPEKLTPMVLGNECYSDMFKDCTSLKMAPALPATKLAVGCYYSMFTGCTSLEKAPELPAETLANSCYFGMFKGCTSLRTAPKLPSLLLEDCCYSEMFANCTSLKEVPVLPAKKLAKKCYWSMFSGCTSIITAPELSADTLAELCYSSMFSGCVSLEKAPKLPATELAKQCYSLMFRRCISLKSTPELPATKTAEMCYMFMFSNCTNLNEITIMATEINAEDCLYEWLENTPKSGTFYKNKNAKWSNDGIVPPGWKVVLVDP